MAELRGAKVPSPDALKALASSMAGFSDSVVEQACQTLERAAVGEYEPRMPTLATLMDACRDAAKVRKPLPEFGLYRCEGCNAIIAATSTPMGGCQGCGHGVLLQTKPPEPEFDYVAYMKDVRARPERYVSVADCIREVIAKRRAQGKPIWNFTDPRRGDAA